MELTQKQRLALAQRIADEFKNFVMEEYTYQVEDMKDMDELSWEYHPTTEEAKSMIPLVVDIVSVTVWELSTKPPTGC